MRPAVVPVPLALLAVGSLLAHELSYRLVAPGADARAHLLAETGHAYLRHAPTVLGVLLALVPACLAVVALGRPRPVHVPAAAFLGLPALGFGVQEHLERWAASGEAPLAAAAEPTFVVGLALQVPFGLAALLAPGLRLAGAGRLAARLRRPPPRARPVRAARPLPPLSTWLRPSRVVDGRSERGPPRHRTALA